MLKQSVNKLSKSVLSVILCIALVMTALPLVAFNNSVSALDPADKSQTKYANITEFQQARWTEIQNAVFDQNYTSVQEPGVIKDLTVEEGNPYFNWTDTSNMQGYDKDGKKTDGGLKKFNTEEYNQKFNASDLNTSLDKFGIQHKYLGYQRYKGSYKDYNGQQQTVTSSADKMEEYYVYTPEQFVFMLYWTAKTTKYETTKIILRADLDMGGASNQIYPNNVYLKDKRLYIEGNGHTVYNLKMYSTERYMGLYQGMQVGGSISNMNSKLIVNNIGFQSVMLLHDSNEHGRKAGLFYGDAAQKDFKGISMSNVHLNMAYYQQRVTGDYKDDNNMAFGLLGGETYASVFFVNNCTTSNAVMYGTSHMSGTFSYIKGNGACGGRYTSDYISDYSVRYDADFPENPEAFVFENHRGRSRYPAMFYNSSSTDCEIFSVGYDSGAFISCGRRAIYRNCYTNNTIYGNSNTGAFIGRAEAMDIWSVSENGKYLIRDDNGNSTIENVFINCYSSGAVEGKVAIGGFTGLSNGYRENLTVESGEHTYEKVRGSTLYINCYSTAMVGMDYSGKYVGGFVGLDDNYSRNVAAVTAPDGEKINAKGSIYVNCYAAGEVGNILTYTDTQKSIASDGEFFDGGYHISEKNMDNGYMPTGGFIGAINIDDYYKSTSKTSNKDSDPEDVQDILYSYTYGYFYNCYYDMQTTGMHEMAIGLAYAETYRDNNGVRQAKAATDTPVRTIPFSVEGIKGIYTEKSDVKKVAGLTGQPSEYKGDDKTLSRMSMDSEKALNTETSAWQYNEGYYPQLKNFMVSDSKDDMSESVFYVADEEQQTEQTDSSGNIITRITKFKSTPVLSLANNLNDTANLYYSKFKPNTSAEDAQFANVSTAYRYSQASTSTVFLNHWNYKMDTAAGSLSTDNNWVCGLDVNKLEKNEEGWFEKTYEGLAAGEYHFKIQANDSMAYNYGFDKFDGNDCTLNVPIEKCKATIMFKYEDIRSKNYRIYAVLKNSDDKWIDEKGNVIENEKRILIGGYEQIKEIWTLAGSFPDVTWDPSKTNYDLNPSDTDEKIYTCEVSFTPDKDDDGNYKETVCEFKVAKDHSWTESYGIPGMPSNNNNMHFKYKEPCTVKFEFNTKTHITKATAISGTIYKVCTDKATEIDFKGFSIIGEKNLTGFNWLESGRELESAEKGKLTETSPGIYEVSFDNIKMGQYYAYKLIENAVNSGAKSYFEIKSKTGNESCKVTFTYDSTNKKTTVSAKCEGDSAEYAIQTVEATEFSVYGSEELTGYFWQGDDTHPQDQSPEAKEQYKVDATNAGKMIKINNSSYQKTFKDVKAGDYVFKVGANGSLDMSWGENDSEDNYKFTLKEQANVTVTFNIDMQTISVTTNPSKALDVKEYVVTGTENLMGKTWDLNDAVMTYNDNTGLYEYIKENVGVYQNYAFKVIEKGKDSGSNISFRLEGNKATYTIKFTYNPKTDVVEKYVYDVEDPKNPTDVTASAIKPVKIDTYSVLGDKKLTGYSWLGLTDDGQPGTKEDQEAATNAGEMTLHIDGNGKITYTKTFNNVPVGRNGQYISLPFKIAANGNWDSGISYGDDTGDNFMLILNGDISQKDTCNVTITFDPNKDKGKITVVTDPADCNIGSIDDSKFVWYVVGDYQLASYDNFKASEKVYDTVRDITSGFKFTSGQNTDETALSWNFNDEKNKASDFKGRIGSNEGGFKLSYKVDGKESEGTFNTRVVDLTVSITQDENNKTISSYNCSGFMPGKQWVAISSYGKSLNTGDYENWKVAYQRYENYVAALKKFNDDAEIYYKILDRSTPKALADRMEEIQKTDEDYYNILVENYGDILASYSKIGEEIPDPGIAPTVKDQIVIGSRNIRLIPTVYLEAGNDANISVYEKNAAKQNVVNYRQNQSPDITFIGLNESYDYYNFAFTAAYAITDKIGLGMYNNYSNQGIQKYDSDKLRNQNESNNITPPVYYAMTSVFNEKASYDDTGTDHGLVADSLVKQALIGSSYDSQSGDKQGDKQYGQTIVKIYRINKSGTDTKVKIDKTASSDSDEYKNYMKWTGQQHFTAEDKGEYNIVFYWALSDGRYLSDSKHVSINVVQPGISKSVDIVCDEAGDNELTYTITYTNSDFSSPLTSFGILDILPFKGDKRYEYKDADGNIGTTGSDVKFKLKNLKIKQNGICQIKGVYYSNSDEVKSWLGDGTESDVATKLVIKQDTNIGLVNDTTGDWKNLLLEDEIKQGAITYSSEDGLSLTAIAVSGVKLGVAESITISITVEYDGVKNDTYVNNAFFTAYGPENSEFTDNPVNGCSNPVSTSIVGRTISGYVWFDENINGIIDDDEPRFKDVTVSLYKKNDKGGFDYADKSVKTTDEGYYTFEGLASGEYRTVIEKTDKVNNTLVAETAKTETKEYRFGNLNPSKKLLEAKTDKVVGSRNLALANKDENKNITSYYVSTNMPTALEIYRGNYTNRINATCDKYEYKKEYLNFGLTVSYSIGVSKVSDDGSQLPGVIFKLERKETDNEGNTLWTQIKYDNQGYVFDSKTDEGTGTGEFITDNDGKIELSNLRAGDYRLVEVKPADGYEKLISPIYLSLPYKVTFKLNEQGEPIYDNKCVELDDNNLIETVTSEDKQQATYSYKRVGFKVVNSKKLYLPQTGSKNQWIITSVGVVIFGTCLGFFYKSKKNRKSKRNST